MPASAPGLASRASRVATLVALAALTTTGCSPCSFYYRRAIEFTLEVVDPNGGPLDRMELDALHGWLERHGEPLVCNDSACTRAHLEVLGTGASTLRLRTWVYPLGDLSCHYPAAGIVLRTPGCEIVGFGVAGSDENEPAPASFAADWVCKPGAALWPDPDRPR